MGRLLKEAVRSEKIAAQIQETFECILSSAKLRDATKAWQANHPLTDLGTYVSNSVAVGKSSNLGAKHMVAQLRKAADDQAKHKTSQLSVSSTFFSQPDTTDVVKRRKSINFQKSHPHLPRHLTTSLSSVGPEDGEKEEDQGIAVSPRRGSIR